MCGVIGEKNFFVCAKRFVYFGGYCLRAYVENFEFF